MGCVVGRANGVHPPFLLSECSPSGERFHNGFALVVGGFGAFLRVDACLFPVQDTVRPDFTGRRNLPDRGLERVVLSDRPQSIHNRCRRASVYYHGHPPFFAC